MKRIIWLAAALAVGLGACVREHAPRAALEACRSSRALLAVRRAVLQEAVAQGAPAALVGRLRRDGRASLEDPEVQDYDRDTGVVSCSAQFAIAPPGGAPPAAATVSYDAEPFRTGRGYRYRLTEAGRMVQAIASLGPLPRELPPASSAAAEVAASGAPIDQTVLEDAAAAGDTGHARRLPPAVAPPKP